MSRRASLLEEKRDRGLDISAGEETDRDEADIRDDDDEDDVDNKDEGTNDGVSEELAGEGRGSGGVTKEH